MRIATLVCLWLIAGCASSGSAPTLSRTGERIVDVQNRSGTLVSTRLHSDDRARTERLTVGFEAAWARLPEVLQEIGLSIGSIDEAGGRVGHSGERVSRIAGKRMAIYLDCGTGTIAQPYANLYAVSLGYEVLIAKQEAGSSLAEMRVEATARPRDVSGNAVRCTSKGTLERLVFERLQASR